MANEYKLVGLSEDRHLTTSSAWRTPNQFYQHYSVYYTATASTTAPTLPPPPPPQQISDLTQYLWRTVMR